MAVIVPHRDALDAVKAWLGTVASPAPHWFAEATAELVAEVERLRAEREPFRVVIDNALEAGLGNGTVHAGVLDLAERLGFTLPLIDLNVASQERRRVRAGNLIGRVDRPEPSILVQGYTAPYVQRLWLIDAVADPTFHGLEPLPEPSAGVRRDR